MISVLFRRIKSILKYVIIVFFVFQFSNNIAQYKKLNFDNITIESGLSHNYIHFIVQDSRGWVWMGTTIGIERYDGYELKEYSLHLNDTISLNHLVARTAHESKKGVLYVGYDNQGLAYLDRNKDNFVPLTFYGNTVLKNKIIRDITEDAKGNLWIATTYGLYYVDLIAQNIKEFLHNPLNLNTISGNYLRKVTLDKKGNIWIGGNNGVDMFTPQTNIFNHLGEKVPILNGEVWEILEIDSGKFLIGTFLHGAIILDPTTYMFQNIVPDKNISRSYAVRSILRDKNGHFWFATRGGLFYYESLDSDPVRYFNNTLDKTSLVHNSILGIIEDKKGDLWINTRGGISVMAIEKQSVNLYTAILGNNNYLNNNEVLCLWQQNKDKIWIGTENGGINIFDRNTGVFIYLTKEKYPKLGSNNIKSIVPDNAGNVLIGTFHGGLVKYNLQTGKLTSFKNNIADSKSISGNIVWDIAVDQDEEIWVGTDKGLDKYSPQTNSFTHIADIQSEKGVEWIFVDKDNDLWLGTSKTIIFRKGVGVLNEIDLTSNNLYRGNNDRLLLTSRFGLFEVDKYKGIVKDFDTLVNLNLDLTGFVLNDELGNLWFSSSDGIGRFNESSNSYRIFNKLFGYAKKSAYKTAIESSNGEFILGGNNGLSIFKPEMVIENEYIPPVYITKIKVFNKSVEIGRDKKSILKKSITETKELSIPYKYNVISLEFAALNFINSYNNKYLYKLDGFDNGWIPTQTQRSVTYTNLNPGRYTFMVKGSNDEGVWNNEPTSLIINVLPPYYKTWWFKIIIIGFIVVLLVFGFTFFEKRKKLQNALFLEKEKSGQLRELDLMKFEFFTNISHELKTPLTLISGPLEKILKFDLTKEEIKENLKVMQKNTRQLLSLVSQLLDYRKLDAGKLEVELKSGDIVSFINEVLYSFKAAMNEKNLNIKFQSVQSEIVTVFDSDKLSKILNNLISNAIKHSNENGLITVSLSIVVDVSLDSNKTNERFMKLVVKDIGEGIQAKQLPKIFNRFYSSSSSGENPSSGIGLAFVKELVELLDGTISAESNPGEGAVFSVLLPYFEERPGKRETRIDREKTDKSNEIEDLPEEAIISKKILLVVEDNYDVRDFIVKHFNKDYVVYEADNGKKGLELAVKFIPDLIVSDIMMPKMNGNELCEKIKNDERTLHIPFILLSVLSSKENTLDGYVKGADDYITKPFDIEILQTKIENLIKNRDALREKYSNELVIKPSNIIVTSHEDKFIKKALRIVEDNIDDTSLDIDKFVEQMNVSRMQLYRKISALTNMTVKEFINDIRLKRAAQLLSENKLSISEVSYMIGFSDVSYFGKCFRKKYNMSATEYANSQTPK